MAARIDRSEIGPSRVWYVIAGVVFGLSLIAGFTVLLVGASKARDGEPKVLTQSSGSVPAQALLSYSTSYVIYVEESDSTPTCTANPSSDVTLQRPQDDPLIELFKRLQGDGRFEYDGKTWTPVWEVYPRRTHVVALSCEGTAFLIGDQAPIVGPLVGGAAGLVGLPCIGFVIAMIIGLVVTVIRRSGSKTRLRIEAAVPYGRNPYQQPGRPQQPGAYGGQYPPQY